MAHREQEPSRSSRPKISVIVAVKNRADLLARCIQSFAVQTHAEKELIIIDGGSTDGTVDVIRAHARHVVYWVSEPDEGIADAWNKGVARATGDWLCFLGADDELVEDAVLAKAAARLERASPKHLLAYGDVLIIDESGRPFARAGERWDRLRFNRKGMLFSHQGVLHHRSLFAEVGGFDPTYRFAADYEWLLRAVAHTQPLYLEGLTVARTLSGGLAADDSNALDVLAEYAHAQRRHLGRTIPVGLAWTAMKAWVKLVLLRIGGQERARRLIDGYRIVTGRRPRWSRARAGCGVSTIRPHTADRTRNEQ